MPISPHIAKRYPADWNLRRRFIIEYRAAGRCEWCGAVNYQPHPDTGSADIMSSPLARFLWPGDNLLLRRPRP